MTKFIQVKIVGTAIKLSETVKITAGNIFKKGKKHRKYKRTDRWTNLKRNKTDCKFGKLVSLTVFQSSILLFVTFDKSMLGR